MSIGCFAVRSIVLAAVVSLSVVAAAAERAQEYEYDDAGRLRKVISPENEVSYALDPAGNRTSLTSAAGRGWPSSITVPATSLTGDYTIGWGASTGSATRYELYEASNSGFSGNVKVYDGTALSAAFTAKPDGTYYYRVRACDATGCGPHRTGANPILVARPPVPGQPGAMTIPSGDIDGSYQISWGSSTGTVTAYELYEAVNGGSFGSTPAYSGTATTPTLSGRGNGTYSYRVRACNTAISCSSYQTGANSVSVTLPPSTPGAVVVPAYNNTGNYTVSWGASATGIVTAYEVLESVLTESLVYSGSATSLARSGKADNVYSYRVRACNTPAACSGYTSAQGMAGSIYVDKIAPTPPASLIILGNGHSLSWSGGSQDSAGAGAGSGVGSWNIYRNGSLVGTSVLGGGGFDDTSQPGNITLNYVVKSVDRAGNESVTSSPTATTYVDTIPPTTPGNLQATSVTVNSVSLAWNASTDANGISWYKVIRTPGTVITGPLHPTTTYVDETVASNTAYNFQVIAVDNYGVQSAPASINVTTPAGAPSIPVMNGAAFTQDSDGIYTISWQASTGSVAYYVLEEQSDGPWNPITVTGTSRGFTQGGGEYAYRVKACTSGGVCSGYSSTRTILICIGGCP